MTDGTAEDWMIGKGRTTEAWMPRRMDAWERQRQGRRGMDAWKRQERQKIGRLEDWKIGNGNSRKAVEKLKS